MPQESAKPTWIFTPQGNALNLAFLSKVQVMTTAGAAWSVIYFHGIGAGKGATVAEKYGTQADAIVAYNRVLNAIQKNVNVFDLSYQTSVSITNIATTTGPAAGGTTVVLTGTGFSKGFSVYLNGAKATNFVFTDPTTISFDTPPNPVGQYSIVYQDVNNNPFVYPMGFTYS